MLGAAFADLDESVGELRSAATALRRFI